MTPKLQQQLMKKYPSVFGLTSDVTIYPISLGISVGDGWYGLVEKVCKHLYKVKNETGLQFEATQIKEKFGSLRFYVSDDNRLVKITPYQRSKVSSDLIDFISSVEGESIKMCEICSSDGELKSTRGWWAKTLCDECHERRQNDRALI
jgi:hypothetical protein